MALTFPTTPYKGQLYYSGSSPVYRYTGTYWVIEQNANVETSSQYNGVVIPGDRSASGYGMVYALGGKIWKQGSNAGNRPHGQGTAAGNLGNAHWHPAPVVNPPALFTKIYESYGNIFGLGDNGLFYTYGDNSTGQHGLGHTSGDSSTGSMNPITSSTAIYGTGKAVVDFWSGELTNTEDWNGSGTQRDPIFVKVNDNGVFKYYSWGYNGVGQLGIGNTTSYYTPQEITTFRGWNIVSMSVLNTDNTNASVFAISSSGDLYAWGYNANARLSIGNSTNQTTPTASINSASVWITNAIDVRVGNYGTGEVGAVVLTSSGSVLVNANFGGYNQGNGVNNPGFTKFTHVQNGTGSMLLGIKQIIWGGGAQGIMALDTGSNLWAWSYNNNGIWGNGTALNTLYYYAQIIQRGVIKAWAFDNYWTIPYMMYTSESKGEIRTYACGANYNYVTCTGLFDDHVTQSSEVTLPPQEYLVAAHAVGSSYFDGGTYYSWRGTQMLTNTGNFYFSGYSDKPHSFAYQDDLACAVPFEIIPNY